MLITSYLPTICPHYGHVHGGYLLWQRMKSNTHQSIKSTPYTVHRCLQNDANNHRIANGSTTSGLRFDSVSSVPGRWGVSFSSLRWGCPTSIRTWQISYRNHRTVPCTSVQECVCVCVFLSVIQKTRFYNMSSPPSQHESVLWKMWAFFVVIASHAGRVIIFHCKKCERFERNSPYRFLCFSLSSYRKIDVCMWMDGSTGLKS